MLLSAGLSATSSYAALTFDSISPRPESYSPGSGTVVWTHTMGTCSTSHGLLIAYLGVNASQSKLGSATYNGVAMTEIAGGPATGAGSGRAYYLVDPPAGANIISVGVNTIGDYGGYSISFCGASANPIDTASVRSGMNSGTGSSITVTASTAGNFLVAFTMSDQIRTFSTADGWTNNQHQNVLASSVSYLAANDTNPHTSSWTWGGGTANWQTMAFGVIPNGVTGSFTISPAAIPSGHSGNITLTLTGTGTSWTGATRFTASGVTGTACAANPCVPAVTDGTHATVTVTTGAGTGSLLLADTVTGISASTAVATPSLSLSPVSGPLNTVQSIALTGTNTLWSTETPVGLFTVTGGTGSSLGTATITTNTAGMVSLTVGSGSGSLIITDTSTGATATFAAGATPTGTFGFVFGQ
jgi:hypothetical protein